MDSGVSDYESLYTVQYLDSTKNGTYLVRTRN